MTRPQISGLTYFNSTSNNVNTEDINFDANLFNVSLPVLGADSGNYSISFLGKKRITTITGTFTDTEANIKNFRKEIETEANSNAQSEKDYTTSDGDTFKVQIARSIFRKDLTSTNQVTYVIDLLTSNNILG